MERELTLFDEEIQRVRVTAKYADNIMVVCNIEPRRENMTANKRAIVCLDNDGNQITIPFNNKVMLPTKKFHELLIAKDMINDEDVSPYKYKIVIHSYHDIESGVQCSRNYESYSYPGKLICDLTPDELANKVKEAPKPTENNPEFWIDTSHEDGNIRVMRRTDKGLELCVKKDFLKIEDAETYIEGIGITE